MTALQDETFVRVKRLTVAMQCKGCYNLSGFFKYCRISCSDFQKKALVGADIVPLWSLYRTTCKINNRTTDVWMAPHG